MKISSWFILAVGLLFGSTVSGNPVFPSLIEKYNEPLGVSYYNLVTGIYPRNSAAYYKAAAAELKSAGTRVDSVFINHMIYSFKGDSSFVSSGIELSKDENLNGYYFHYLGMIWLAQNKFQLSRVAFGNALGYNDSIPNEVDSTLLFLSYYLEKVSKEKHSPALEHFNGGFGYFLRDSLKWNQQVPGDKLNLAVRAIGEFMYFFPGAGPEVFECAGDLMYIFPDRFFSRWYSSLAYLHASRLFPQKSEQRTAWETKIKYALEADRLRPVHFNRARFSDLLLNFDSAYTWNLARLKTIEADENARIKDGKLSEIQPIWVNYAGDYSLSVYFTYRQFGFLPLNVTDDLIIYMAEQHEIEMERLKPIDPNGDPMSRDLKRQGIKKNLFFNVYALLVIAIILACLWFFFRQIRKIDKEVHGDPAQ